MKQLTIIGHVGADPVIKTVNGDAILDFSIAVNEKFKKNDGTSVENTTWFQCSTKNLKLASFIKKGDKMMVQGNFKIGIYKDGSNNAKVGIDVRASKIEFLGSKDADKETLINDLRKVKEIVGAHIS